MGFLSLQVHLGVQSFTLTDFCVTLTLISCFSWVTAMEIVQMETWPGVTVGGAESQPSLTDDSQMQNKFFKANRMQRVFYDQDLSSSNTVISAMFSQSKKIMPQDAEVHKTLKLRLKSNLNPTWKIGHMLPIGNRIYSGRMLGHNPESLLPTGKPFLFIVLCCEAFPLGAALHKSLSQLSI